MHVTTTAPRSASSTAYRPSLYPASRIRLPSGFPGTVSRARRSSFQTRLPSSDSNQLAYARGSKPGVIP